MVLKMKSCPRCNGDIAIDKDIYGWYEKCIQCGYLGFLENMLVNRPFRTEQVRDSTVCFDESVIWGDDGQGELALALS